jgi:hypothetical protein
MRTDASEVSPREHISNGDSPSSEQIKAIVYGVVDVVLLIVASLPAPPTILMTQKMARKIHPEVLLMPWRFATAMLKSRQGTKKTS